LFDESYEVRMITPKKSSLVFQILEDLGSTIMGRISTLIRSSGHHVQDCEREGAWFDSLPRHIRRIATTLATGETTKRTAREFRVSPGRISQTRRELEAAWQQFQGEAVFA
jgi:hypothetical protein